MRRFHLIELHEQSWYPDVWRQLFQLALGKLYNLMNDPMQNVLDRFREFLIKARPEVVLELCSGSGEFSSVFWKSVKSSQDAVPLPTLLLSDLYPNIESFERLKEESGGDLDYLPQTVNALDPPEISDSIWMMNESLHHFRPAEVREILQNATRRAQGLAVFELTQRSWKNILFVLLASPIVSTIVTVFLVRPFRFRNILWGLLIPVVPFTFVFDSIVSDLRSYTISELQEIIRSLEPSGFEWSIGTAPIPNTPGLELTYLLGRKSDDNPT